MTQFGTAEVEGTDLEPRDVRALTEVLTVLPDQPEVAGADELYLVVSESGSEYTVDARHGSSTCPDAIHRDAMCKHQRRVAYATGERSVPAWIDTDAVDGVDEQLGEHTEAVPRVVASDGGIIEAGDDGEILEGGADERPADWDCWDADGELPCFVCYEAGFEEPNPDASG